MTTVVTGRPGFVDRLVHVESLLYYDGELLGHYTLDDKPWLVSWTNWKDLGAQYWEAHLYFDITPENLKKLNTNEMTLREAMEAALVMWREEDTWDHDEQGHGAESTSTIVWTQITMAQFPEDEKPSVDSYINYWGA